MFILQIVALENLKFPFADGQGTMPWLRVCWSPETLSFHGEVLHSAGKGWIHPWLLSMVVRCISQPGDPYPTSLLVR